MVKFAEKEVPPDDLIVLVVDDNIDSATSLCCLLELLGCKTAIAYDGPTAVQVGGSAHPHLVIIDLDLPGFDGCEVLRQLKASGSIGPGLSVCLTGHGGPKDRTRCFEVGFDEFWSKPLELSDLHRALASSREAVRKRAPSQQGGVTGPPGLMDQGQKSRASRTDAPIPKAVDPPAPAKVEGEDAAAACLPGSP